MIFNPKRHSIISFDMDQTICVGECFTEEECLTAAPNQNIIDVINWLKANIDECYIKIYTARKDSLRLATEYWLKKHNVNYNELVMHKSWAEYYIDDRNVSLADVINYVKQHKKYKQ